jgi:Kef-type K+ transport system membrane component KefB
MPTTLGTTIEFQMSLLLFLALLGYHIAFHIKQSSMVGQILVGILIGPSLFGWITYAGFVEGLAHLGAVVLLFVIGLQFHIRDIFQPKYFVIALAGVVVPWLGGYMLSQYYGFDFKAAVFIGTALTATSIAITANVLREMGKLKTRVAQAIIGAAVIDDILGLVVLAVSNQLAQGHVSPIDASMIFLKAIAFMAVGSIAGQKLLRPYIEGMDANPLSRKYPEMTFIFAMMMAFLYSIAAEALGLSAIVGAFLAGTSFSGLRLKYSRDFHEGSEYLHIIFASIFFISLGILVDTHQIDYGIVGFLIALTSVAILTKVVGCWAASWLQGMGHKDSLIIGFGMSPRGEVAMIVGLIGLTSKIIDQQTYAAIIFMSLLTTIITPVILQKWLD